MSKSLCDCACWGISSCVLGGRKKGQYLWRVDEAIKCSRNRMRWKKVHLHHPCRSQEAREASERFNSNRDIKRREWAASFMQCLIHFSSGKSALILYLRSYFRPKASENIFHIFIFLYQISVSFSILLRNCYLYHVSLRSEVCTLTKLHVVVFTGTEKLRKIPRTLRYLQNPF